VAADDLVAVEADQGDGHLRRAVGVDRAQVGERGPASISSLGRVIGAA
jgi:hypothetical protein